MMIEIRADRLARLPTIAVEKVERINEGCARRHGASRSFTDRANDLRPDILEAQNRLRHLVDRRRPVDEGQLMPVREEIRTLQAKAERLLARANQEQELNSAAGNLLTKLDWFIQDSEKGTQFGAWTGAPAKLLKGEDLQSGIERLRLKIDERRNVRAAKEVAPPPLAEVVERVKALVAGQGNAGVPDVGELLAPKSGPIGTPTRRALCRVPGLGVGSVEIPDVLAILAWLLPEQLTAALVREVTALAEGDEEAIPTADRAAILAKLDAELLAAEREEESLIEQAEAAGLEIDRRGDADPRAVFGIVVKAPVARLEAAE